MHGHLSGLDGIRAVAVLMVVCGHAARFPDFPAGMRALMVVDIAQLGVVVFFVLSGFLITTLLVGERERTGHVSLGAFYARRSLRILPPAFAYIAVAFAAARAGMVSLAPGDVLHAVTYTMNYHHERAWSLGHLWSLSVEEQFYLAWPLAFLLAGRHALAVATGVLVAAPALRVLGWVAWPEAREGIDEEFQFVCDALATGCALALLAHHVGLERLARRVPAWLAAVAPLVALASAACAGWPSFYLPLGGTLVNLSIAVCILWVVGHPDTVVARLLESRPAVGLGLASYSLYLWQQLFLDTGAGDAALGMRLALALAAALASYWLLEKPLLALRARYRP